MKQLKQLTNNPSLLSKLGANALVHGGAQAAVNYFSKPTIDQATVTEFQKSHDFAVALKKLHGSMTDFANLDPKLQLTADLKQHFAAFMNGQEDHDEINSLKGDNFNNLPAEGKQLADLLNQQQTTGKLIQNVSADFAGNLVATAGVTALEMFGISNKVAAMTKDFVSPEILGAVVGAVSNIAVSSGIKLNFTDLFQLTLAGAVGASNGYNTASIIGNNVDFDALNQEEGDFIAPVVVEYDQY